MATMSEDKKEPNTEQPEHAEQEDATGSALAEADEAAPQQLGVQKYVLAGFFAAGIVVAYLCSNIVLAAWNLAANASSLTFLNRIAEDDRGSLAMLAGAVIGAVVAVRAYRREALRNWINEVASELTKVTWPDKKEVTNSTVVVVLASAFATVFLALLDRFWGFVTNLVYGT